MYQVLHVGHLIQCNLFAASSEDCAINLFGGDPGTAQDRNVVRNEAKAADRVSVEYLYGFL